MRGNTGFHFAPDVNAVKGPRDHDERLPLDGRVLHIAERDGFYEVWLNTEVSDFDGIHIGEGESRDAAVMNAITTLETAAAALRRLLLTEEEAQLVIGAIPLQALPDTPYKGPINQSCSACSAGDTAMEYHDHDYVAVENRR
jgi:hypothetical protein